jgi:hypothetical protein
MMFVTRTVILGEREAPTICTHTEVSRLLHRRLEVIEAALLKLSDLQSRAATTPEAVRGCSDESRYHHLS